MAIHRDVNHDWQSGVEPLPLPEQGYLGHGDPLQHMDVKDNASKTDVDWHEQEAELMKQAIVNAFRAVILSPQKNLKWNAIQYQDLMHVPYSVTDPNVFWDILEQSRRRWNAARGRHPLGHLAHYKEMQDFYRWYQAMHPDMNPKQAHKEAERELRIMQMEIEDKFLREDEQEGKSWDAIEPKIFKEMKKAIKNRIDPNINPARDADEQGIIQYNKSQQEQLFSAFVPQQDIFGNESPELYAGFIGKSLYSIALVGQYADDLTVAALRDIHDYGGTGHYFRKAVLDLNIPGVGPKVISFAWLLLQPLTSELATIDTHMLDMLGHDKVSPRDYFKYERELAAGRDAAGYGHMPLGQFQWGLWDHTRTGAGSHQDHSALRVLNPSKHDQVEWHTSVPKGKGKKYEPPEWWQNTQAARQQVGEQFDQEYGSQFPASKIPYAEEPIPVHGIISSFKAQSEISLSLPPNIKRRLAYWVGAEIGDDLIILAGRDPSNAIKEAAKDFNLEGALWSARRINRFNYATFEHELRRSKLNSNNSPSNAHLRGIVLSSHEGRIAAQSLQQILEDQGIKTHLCLYVPIIGEISEPLRPFPTSFRI